jgi:hypothetical protein
LSACISIFQEFGPFLYPAESGAWLTGSQCAASPRKNRCQGKTGKNRCQFIFPPNKGEKERPPVSEVRREATQRLLQGGLALRPALLETLRDKTISLEMRRRLQHIAGSVARLSGL